GFSLADLSVSGATATNFNGNGREYTLDLIPNADGQVKVELAKGKVKDEFGNANSVAYSLSRIFDSTRPSVSLNTSANAFTNVNPIPFEVDFSESVSGMTAEQLQIVGGSVVDFVGSGANYTFFVVPSGEGLISVFVP